MRFCKESDGAGGMADYARAIDLIANGKVSVKNGRHGYQNESFNRRKRRQEHAIATSVAKYESR